MAAKKKTKKKLIKKVPARKKSGIAKKFGKKDKVALDTETHAITPFVSNQSPAHKMKTPHEHHFNQTQFD